MKKGQSEVHAETRSSRREPNPPPSALSAPPREKQFGWQIKTLGEVCDVINGGTPKTNVPEYWDGNHRWITPAEMGKRLSPYVSDTERKITDLGLRDSSARMLPPNSVILSSRAPIGHLVINTEPTGTNQGCKGLIPCSQIETKFLYYHLGSIVDLLNSLGTGATFKELSGGKLKEVTIPVPPLDEQQRIVGLLDEAFEGLATAKANAEKNLQNARALFESHLQSVFTQRGVGWVEKPFKECIEDVKYTTKIQRKEFLEEGEFPIVSQEADFTNGYWDNAADVFKVTRPVVIFGDHTQVLKYIDFDFVLGADGVKLLPPKPFLNPKFFFYALRSAPLKSLGYARHYRLLKELQIGYPDTHAQVAIAKKLDAIENETQRLARLYEQKLASLEALKKSLLQQAFSGQL